MLSLWTIQLSLDCKLHVLCCHSFSPMQRKENAGPLRQKVVAQKESKVNLVIKMAKTAVEDMGLERSLRTNLRRWLLKT